MGEWVSTLLKVLGGAAVGITVYSMINIGVNDIGGIANQTSAKAAETIGKDVKKGR